MASTMLNCFILRSFWNFISYKSSHTFKLHFGSPDYPGICRIAFHQEYSLLSQFSVGSQIFHWKSLCIDVMVIASSSNHIFSFFFLFFILSPLLQPYVDFGLKLMGADLMAIPGLYRFVQVYNDFLYHLHICNPSSPPHIKDTC